MGYFSNTFFKLEGHEINTDITGHIDVFISRRRFTQNESLPFSLTKFVVEDVYFTFKDFPFI